jgi:hypothetical protein
MTAIIAEVNLVAAEALAAQQFADVEPLYLEIFDIEIETDQEAAEVGEFLKNIKRVYKEIDAARENITKPIHALHQQANKLFTPALRSLTEKEVRLKAMLGRYMHRKQEEQRKLLQEAAQAAQAVAAQARTLGQARQAVAASANVQVALQRAQAVAPAKVEGVSVGEVWRAEVLDAALVPVDYWTLDQRKLDAAVKAGVRSIPGVRIFSEAAVRVRT